MNDSAIERYQRDGFAIIPGFVSDETCARLRAEAARIVETFPASETASVFSTVDQTTTTDAYFLASGDQVSVFFEAETPAAGGRQRAVNKIGHALHDLNPVFDRFCRDPSIAGLAGAIGFCDPLLLQSMYIFKQPRVGGVVSLHQDATFLYTDPITVVGLWFALEDATRENGCLWAIPGGHRAGLKVRFVRGGEGGTSFQTLDTAPWPEDQLVPLEVRRGDAVILSGLLPHMSYPNRSARSREAFTLHLIEGAADYPADNWLRRSPTHPLRGFTR